MTDNYLRQAKEQLERDLVPGHPLRRVVEELIEAREKLRSVVAQIEEEGYTGWAKQIRDDCPFLKEKA